MPDIAILAAAALGLCLVLALCVLAALRANLGSLRRELDALRSDRDDHRGRCAALEGDLRCERDAHGLTRSDVSRLEQAERGLRETVEKLEAAAADLGTRHAELQDRHGELQSAHARLQADTDGKLATAEERIAELKALRVDMTERFKGLANDLLKEHSDSFGTLNRERLDALMKPMRQQVEHFQKELRDAHSAAAKDRERLAAEIGHLSRRSEEVSREAVALTKALKGDKQKQGAWGEMVLERLLEDSGLTRGREYETQFTVRTDEGTRRRPDVVVRLPGGKAVVIDAKVSLVAYEAAVNAEDEEERQRHLRAHVAALRAHIDELARRDYGTLVDGSVDYVLMFMPVEGALSAALEAQGDLTAHANLKRVGIATPTTLMLALRTIQHVWTVENRQQNAEAIAERAGLLHDKLVGVIEEFTKVGTHLSKANEAHNVAFDRLTRGNGNLVGQVDKLKQLGARTTKTLDVNFDEAPAEDRPPALERTAAE